MIHNNQFNRPDKQHNLIKLYQISSDNCEDISSDDNYHDPIQLNSSFQNSPLSSSGLKSRDEWDNPSLEQLHSSIDEIKSTESSTKSPLKQIFKRCESWNAFVKNNLDTKQFGIGRHFLHKEEQNQIYNQRQIFKWDQILQQGRNYALSNALSIHSDPNYLDQEEELLIKYIEDKQKNQEVFKKKILKGPPMKYRWSAWKVMFDITSDSMNDSEQIYKWIIELDEFSFEKQIIKDLARTFPHEKYFLDHNNYLNFNIGQQSLFRVLKGISIYYPKIGYCQGMNFIAAFLLIMSGGKEVEAFTVFVHILGGQESINTKRKCYPVFYMTGMFEEGFPLFYLLRYIFNKRIEKKLNKLHTHFKQQQLDDITWMFQWLETLYLYNMPFKIVIRIWDYLCVQGLRGIIDIGMAFLHIFKNQLYKMEFSEIIQFFNERTKEIITEKKDVQENPDALFLDPEKLIKQAKSMAMTNLKFKTLAQQYLLENPKSMEYESIQKFLSQLA